jgi:hypothetical protein
MALPAGNGGQRVIGLNFWDRSRMGLVLPYRDAAGLVFNRAPGPDPQRVREVGS